jgi:hypothetical protein
MRGKKFLGVFTVAYTIGRIRHSTTKESDMISAVQSRAWRGAGPGPAILFFFLLFSLALPGRSAADPYRDAALTVTQQLLMLFPPAEGFVVSLPAGEVFIDLAEGDLMRPGMELLVYREGDEIVHPISGDVLGIHEDRLGYITIREVEEKYSVGLLSGEAGEVRPGDRVRISARPLRVLLLFSGESPYLETGSMARSLLEATDESRRFRLTDEPEWLPRLKELELTIDELLADAEVRRRLGKEVKADLLVVVSAPAEEDSTLGIEVRSLWTGRTLAEFRQPWSAPEEVEYDEPRKFSPFSLFRRREQRPSKREYVTKDLSTAALNLVTGDFTGEDDLEVMITDGIRISLYGWSDGGLIWKWESEKDNWQILDLGAGDLDGDGRDEVFVTKVRRGQLLTEALSWGAGEWHSKGRLEGGFLRILPGDGGQSVLLGQKGGVTTVFTGPVREYTWEDNTFKPGGSMVLPREVDILGMGLDDVDGDGEAEILYLDSAGRLNVLSPEGEHLSSTKERFGGYPSRVTPEEYFGPRLVDGGVMDGYFRTEHPEESTGKSVTEDIFASFQGRILSGRGEDGSLLVALPRNYSGAGKVLPNLRKFGRGEVVILQWVDGRFEELRRSRKQEGYVADVAWGDTDGDGEAELLTAVNLPTGRLLKQAGSLVTWSYGLGGEIPEKGE